MTTTKTLRAGSAQKRAAILVAARELFLADGFDRSSVDAIAARAEVSKRTVYDYFGDKQQLLRAVVDAVGESLVATVRRTLDETIPEAPATIAQVEGALVTFALRIATDMLGSTEYAALHRLVLAESAHLPEPAYNSLADAPDEAIAERLSTLADAGLLEVSDPRLAADQFLALTFGVAIDRLGSANAGKDDRVERLIVEGVRTFVRAYRAN
ncbi:TetR family transcriptional regulator [Nocardioides albertanoniae]|uniref:TetR family transcriptional regulator n=1 Tax=Nocardioides albertanoniae TaxID=1175486 RepID=A0A543A8P5_9ACTN|nr:TetR/AcrR family transcriptional regulator [Nocardioides albertanoniae]TQL68978.1 TetR family transcriptional regulator [Nocardioides albertanoniae]